MTTRATSRSRRTIALGAVLGLLLTMFTIVTAQAIPATYFVDDTGPSCPFGPGAGTLADPYCTIGQGITASSSGDTVKVADGSYNELVVVNKAITLKGAQAGVDARTGRPGAPESIVNGAGLGGAIQVTADPATVDGFYVKNVAEEGSLLRAGIWASSNAAFTGLRVTNNIVLNNVIGITMAGGGLIDRNYVLKNNLAGSSSGNDIYADSPLNAMTVSDNRFAGPDNLGINIAAISASEHTNVTIKRNTFDGTQTDISAFGVNGLTIGGPLAADGNTFNNPIFNGIYLGDFGTGFPNTNPTIKNNTFNVDAAQVIGARRAMYVTSANGAVNISDNKINVTGTFTGGNGLIGLFMFPNPADFNGDSIGTPTSVTIFHNTFNGGAADTSGGGGSLVSHGIRFDDTTPAVAGGINVTCNSITKWVDGVNTDSPPADVHVNKNNLVRNTVFGADNVSTTTTLDAKQNWWGLASGPGPVGPGGGDDVSTNVDFSGFLAAPDACAPTPTPSLAKISVNDDSSTEGSTVNFNITLDGASAQTVKVNWATANNGSATAGAPPNDYTANSGTATFPPGTTSVPVNVATFNDTADEPNETFVLNLSSPVHGTILDGQGVGTILDNDPSPTLTINDVNTTEGNSGSHLLTFTVKLSKATQRTVTVHYQTANGSAVAPTDYVATSGNLTFTPGQTVKTFTVSIKGDTTSEPNEVFFALLNSAVNATFGDPNGAGGIINDDGGTLSAQF